MRWVAALKRRFAALRLTERIHRRTNFQRGFLYIGARRALMGGKWTPLDYFRRGEQGVWYEPSLENGTLFQDAAGTTPVTGIEQPVGLMLDKSGRGNHAYQTTAASRPVLSARVNLLPLSQPNTIPPTPPDTIVTVDATGLFGGPIYSIVGNGYLALNGSTGAGYVRMRAGVAHCVSFFSDSSTPIQVYMYNGYGPSTVVPQYFGLYRHYRTQTPTVDEWCALHLNSADGKKCGGFMLEVGTTPTKYQHVNTATDYDTAGFPLYLRTDGIDDFMVTNSIDFTGTDKMTVVTGLRKIGTAASVPIELSTATNTNAGAFGVYTQDGTNSYSFTSRGRGPGPATVIKSPAAYAPPITNVITGISNISAPLIQLRVDGSVTTTVTTSQGTGNFGNYPLYLFRRDGTSLPFNGNFYGLIIRGAETQEALLNLGQKYIAGKTGVVL